MKWPFSTTLNFRLEMLNCQFFVAAQTNPHIVPFFFNEQGKNLAALSRTELWKLLKKYNPCGNSLCTAAAYYQCTKCQDVFYCSQDCQLLHWPDHKPTCKKTCGKKKSNKEIKTKTQKA